MISIKKCLDTFPCMTIPEACQSPDPLTAFLPEESRQKIPARLSRLRRLHSDWQSRPVGGLDAAGNPLTQLAAEIEALAVSQ
jgi:hypothetical protein